MLRPSRSRVPILLSIATALTGCDGPDDPIEKQEPRALLAQEGEYYSVELAPSGPRGQAMRAEGYLVLPIDYTMNVQPAWPPGDVTESSVQLTGSCGVTFVSPRHAITAGHCTQGLDAYAPVSVRIPRLRRDYDWMSGTSISGTYPNFKHPLNAAYAYDEYDCELVSRCGSAWGPLIDCDITMADAGFGTSDTHVRTVGDIALLRCDEEVGDAQGYVEVPDSFTTSDSLLMPWYHEVYDIAEGASPSLDEHYVELDAGVFDEILSPLPQPNYHYIGGDDRHQLLPLMSTDEASRWNALSSADARSTQTTLLGCHGTSGSGVMRHNPETGLPELLGPVATGTMGERLCYPTRAPGTPGVSFTGLGYTQYFSDRALTADCEAPPSAYPSVLFYWLTCVRGWSIFFEEALWWNPFPECVTCNFFSRFRAFQPPVALLSTATPINLSLTPQTLGVRYRTSVRVYGMQMPTSVTVRVGNEVVATHVLGGNETEWVGNVPSILLSGSFVASATSDGPLTVEATTGNGQGQIGISDVVLVEDGRGDVFGSMSDRESFALVRDAQAPAEAMRFAAGQSSTHAAVLQPGERMFANWQAMVADRSWDLTLQLSEGSDLMCGLVFPDGSEVSTACSQSGQATVLHGEGSATPVGWFVENHGNYVAVIEDAQLSEQPASACPHDKCTTGAALTDECSPCITDICAQDPFCCTSGWDGLCVTEVRTVCGSLMCDEAAGSCAHGVCESGVALNSGCDTPPMPQSCVKDICVADPYCCNNSWDSICIGEVATVCQQNCD